MIKYENHVKTTAKSKLLEGFTYFQATLYIYIPKPNNKKKHLLFRSRSYLCACVCVSYLASRYSRGSVSTSWWAIPDDIKSFSTSESTITLKYAHTQSSQDSHTVRSWHTETKTFCCLAILPSGRVNVIVIQTSPATGVSFYKCKCGDIHSNIQNSNSKIRHKLYYRFEISTQAGIDRSLVSV